MFNKTFIYKYYRLKITTLVLASSVLKSKTKYYQKRGLNVIQEAMNFSMTLYIYPKYYRGFPISIKLKKSLIINGPFHGYTMIIINFISFTCAQEILLNM